MSVKELLHWNNIHDDTWMNTVWTYIMILLFELEKHIEVQCRHKLEYDNKWPNTAVKWKCEVPLYRKMTQCWVKLIYDWRQMMLENCKSSWVTVISTSQYTGMSSSSVIHQSLLSRRHYNGSRIRMRMRERDNGRRSSIPGVKPSWIAVYTLDANLLLFLYWLILLCMDSWAKLL